MNQKDYLDFLETKDINWTIQYHGYVYIFYFQKVKKNCSLTVMKCPKKNINFKKKRLTMEDEKTFHGKSLEEVKAKMLEAKLFDKQRFEDVKDDILVIDKFSH